MVIMVERDGLKPGAWSLSWVSYMEKGAQGLEPSSTAFLGHAQRAVPDRDQQRYELMQYGMLASQDKAYSTTLWCQPLEKTFYRNF